MQNEKQKLYDSFKNVILRSNDMGSSDNIYLMFYELFNTWCKHRYKISYSSISPFDDPDDTEHNDDKDKEITIDSKNFHNSIIKLGFEWLLSDFEYIYVHYEKQLIISYKYNYVILYSNDDLDENSDTTKMIQSVIDEYVIDDDDVEIGILVNKGGSYFIQDEDLKRVDIDVKNTYNDDIPLKAFEDFIKNESSGLALLYGEPGTGKTTFIKYLMQEYDDQSFCILDSNLLYNITAHSLLDVFVRNKDMIYILEDCEKLLVSRENETNPIIATFLNMSDGILASLIKCKFICTFNTNLENIDDAIKRKGRMKLKYEFKKLSPNKVKQLTGKDVSDGMTIADVVFISKDNDFSVKHSKKIGFSV